MEIKGTLNKPYTEKQRIEFIIEQNHKHCYEIRENDNSLEAWGYTEEEKEQQGRDRLNSLSMTRSDFFDGMIMAFGLNATELRAVVENILNTLNIADTEKKVALNNYDNALNFYRKHTLFTLLSGIDIPISEGKTINISNEQWDKFYDETNNHNPDAYKMLIE